jgi:hypothetical protein
MTRSRAVASWVVGAVVYLVAALAWNYDGAASLVVTSMCAAVVSAVAVGVALLVGLVLRPTPVGHLWRSSEAWAVAAVVASLLLLCGGSAVGLTTEYIHPDTGERFEALHPAAALGGYFLLVTSVALWPIGSRGDSPSA